MKIIHTADLHIGKHVNGFSMIQEQSYILEQIKKSIIDESVDVLIIAGDIYDKRNPSDESVALFNTFLSDVSRLEVTVLIISGNHDSGIKLQFGHEILENQNIYIVGEYTGKIKCVQKEDEFGFVNFYLMPFVRPADVRKYYSEVTSYHDALEIAINKTILDDSERNIFIGHQFFAGGQDIRSDSEIVSVGGLDNVAYTILTRFDYAALGHLHKPQQLGLETIRYSGSPVIYSESEVNDKKSFVLIEIKEKGNLAFEKVRLLSKRQFRTVKGYLRDIVKMEKSDDYVFVTLLDDDVIDALNKVRAVFVNVMSLDFDNTRTRLKQEIIGVEGVEDIPMIELFEQFFEKQNNQEMSERQESIVKEIIERIDDHASH